MNDQTGGIQPNAQGSDQENWRHGQGTKVGTIVIITARVIMSEMGITTATKTTTWVTIVREMIGVDPIFHLKIVKLFLGMVDVDMMPNMMRRFDASDEHTKKLMNDLAGIGKKVDTHAISIKNHELQIAQLSATLPGTLPSNTVQNQKHDGHCMIITTRGGKQIIDPPNPSGVEKVKRDDNTVVEVSGELQYKVVKDVEVPQKVTPCLDHQQLFHKG